tara:strand:- start:9110 stop:9547 length:438 start_codon:yes stop_codon:yes gene_type:complete
MADQRSSAQRYSYFIRGRQIIIVEHKTVESLPVGLDQSPSYQPPSGGSDSLIGSNAGLTGRQDAFLLEYTAIPDLSGMVSEKDEIPLPDGLNEAVVNYCKAMLLDDPKDAQLREYYLAKFKERVSKYARAKVGGLRRVQGTGFMR